MAKKRKKEIIEENTIHIIRRKSKRKDAQGETHPEES